MGHRIRDHWLAAVGIITFLPAIWRAIKSALDLSGYADLIMQHISNPGWVGTIVTFIAAPPAWSIIPSILFGCLLIYLDVRRTLSKHGIEYLSPKQKKFVSKRFLSWGTIKRDMPLGRGAHYIMTGNWKDNEKRLNDKLFLGFEVEDVNFTIRQAAIDGNITIWGKEGFFWTEIDSKFWKKGIIESLFSYPYNAKSPPFSELMCSKVQFKRIDWETCRIPALDLLTDTQDFINLLNALPPAPAPPE